MLNKSLGIKGLKKQIDKELKSNNLYSERLNNIKKLINKEIKELNRDMPELKDPKKYNINASLKHK